MSKEKVINYVMTSPNNTNPAILGEMLDEISGGSESGIIVVPLVIDINTGRTIIQKPWKEIYNALGDGKIVIAVKKGASYSEANGITIVYSAISLKGKYNVSAYYYADGQSHVATAETEDDFPSWEDD